MKPALFILTLFAFTLLASGEETAIEIARRVIQDKSSVYKKPQSIPMGILRIPYQDPNENKLVEAAGHSQNIIKEYIEASILKDDTPEKMLLSYAIQVLHSKRIPWETNPNMLGIDTEKNQSYLEDGLKLAARLNEITKEAEQAGTGQTATRPESKSEGSEKPQPESEGRSR
jgi:hypothetical protein